MRLLLSLSEHERAIEYFSGHQCKALLELISEGLVVAHAGTVRITESGHTALRLNSAVLRPRAPPKLLWWIPISVGLLLISHLCMNCFKGDDHAGHHDHNANGWVERAYASR
jgi:hypothetical protein